MLCFVFVCSTKRWSEEPGGVRWDQDDVHQGAGKSHCQEGGECQPELAAFLPADQVTGLHAGGQTITFTSSELTRIFIIPNLHIKHQRSPVHCVANAFPEAPVLLWHIWKHTLYPVHFNSFKSHYLRRDENKVQRKRLARRNGSSQWRYLFGTTPPFSMDPNKKRRTWSKTAGLFISSAAF